MNFTVAKVALCMEVRKRPVFLFCREYDFVFHAQKELVNGFPQRKLKLNFICCFSSSDAVNRSNAQKHQVRMFWDSRPGMTVLKTKQFHWLDVFNAPTISIPLSPAPQKKKKKETQENKTNPLLPTPPEITPPPPPKKQKKKTNPPNICKSGRNQPSAQE